MSSPRTPDRRPESSNRGFLASLSAFMEERNIFWGELVGGLLVIGCALALVISLWDTLESNPFFRLGTFTGGTVALLLVGIYTATRWKLESTSRGLLWVGMLLVPIQMLALTLPGRGSDAVGLEMFLVLLSIVLLAWPVYRTSRILAPENALALALGILLTTLCQVPTAWLVDAGSPTSRLVAIGLLAVAGPLLVGLALVRRLTRSDALSIDSVHSFYVFLGITLFSCGVVLTLEGLLARLTSATVFVLSIPIGLAALPVLTGGLLIHSQLDEHEEAHTQGGYRTAGTILALAAMVVEFAVLWLAWPNLPILLAISATLAILGTVLAFSWNVRLAHLMEIPCWVAASLFLMVMVSGSSGDASSDFSGVIWGVLGSSTSGLVLLIPLGLCLGLVEWLDSPTLGDHRKAYAFTSALLAVGSLGLLTTFGPGNPLHAALGYSILSLGLLAFNLRWQKIPVTYTSLALLVGASFWAVLGFRQIDPVALGLLFSVEAVVLFHWGRLQTRWGDSDPWEHLSAVCAALGIASLVSLCVPGRWGEFLDDLRPLLTLIGVTVWSYSFAVSRQKLLWFRLSVLPFLLTLGLIGCHLAERWTFASLGEVLAYGCSALALLLMLVRCFAESERVGLTMLFRSWGEAAAVPAIVSIVAVSGLPAEPVLALPVLALSASAWLLAWREESPWPAHLGIILSLLALGELFSPLIRTHPANTLGFLFLGFSTLALAVSAALARSTDEQEPKRIWIGEPLEFWGLLTSVFSVVPLAYVLAKPTLGTVGVAVWLAVLWFALAWQRRSGAWFFASQLALLLAGGLGVNLWLDSLDEPLPLVQKLQVYGLALGVYVLVAGWCFARFRNHPRLADLIETSAPIDELLFAGLILGQLVLSVVAALPALVTEIVDLGWPFRVSVPTNALWSGLLVALLLGRILILRGRRSPEALLTALFLLGWPLCVMLSTTFVGTHSGASSLSWVLTLGFLLFSALFWVRDILPSGLIGSPEGRQAERCLHITRFGLLAGFAVPVVGLLVARVWCAVVGVGGPGPEVGSVFARLGVLANVVGPSALVCAVLWGYALRERRSEYALAVALLVGCLSALIFYYAQPPAGHLPTWLLRLVRIEALVFSTVGVLWLACRRRLFDRPADRGLFTFHIGLVTLITGSLFVGLLTKILVLPRPFVGRLTEAAWIEPVAFVLWAGLVYWLFRERSRGRVFVLTSFGLVLGVLVAWSAGAFSSQAWLALHVLESMWFLLAGSILLSNWRQSNARLDQPWPIAFLVVVGWVAGLLVSSLRDASLVPWWTAGGIALLSAYSLGFARWLRSEIPVLASALALHAALGIVQGYFHLQRGIPLDQLALGTSHLLLMGVFGLVWLTMHRHSESDEASRVGRLLLTGYLGVLLLGELALLVGPLALLIYQPGHISPWVLHTGNVWAWLSLALTVAVCLRATRVRLLGDSRHFLRALAVAVLVMTSCTVARYDSGDWLAYHTLQVGGLALVFGFLALGWSRSSGPRDESTDDTSRLERERFAWALVGTIASLILAVNGLFLDPGHPWWPSGVIFAASLVFGLFACWQRREVWAFVGTLTLEAGVLVLLHHAHKSGARPFDFSFWLRVLVLVAMLACLVWMLVGRVLSSRGRDYGTPYLTGWIAVGLASCLYLLVYPAVMLIAHPVKLASIVIETGSALSLACLASVAVVGALKLRPRGGWRIVPALTAGIGLLGVLTACAVARWDVGNWLSFRVLTSVWLAAGPILLALGAYLVRRERDLPESDLRRERRTIRRWIDGCVSGSALAVLLLAVRGFLSSSTLLPWCSFWIGFVAVESAVLAVWRKSESWAVLTTLGLDLLVTLWVWDAPPLNEKAPFWMWLLQANVLSTALAGLLWLVAARRIYGEERPRVAEAPLLSFQVLLMIVGNGVLLLNPSFLELVRTPGSLSPEVAAADGFWGWLTFGLTALTIFAYLWLTRMHEAVHVLGTLGMGAGVLAAFTAAEFDRGSWLAYHVLMLGWTLVGAAMLLAGWRFSSPAANAGEEPRVSIQVVQGWLAASGLPVLLLAVRGVLHDPTGAWWSSGVIAALSVLAALLGIWRRRVGWTALAGLGVNLTLSLALWRANRGVPLLDWGHLLLEVNILAFSAMALLWMLLVSRLERDSTYSKRSLVFIDAQLALSSLGLFALLCRAGFWLVVSPAPLTRHVEQVGEPLLWGALLANLVAWIVLVWVRGWEMSSARLVLLGLPLVLATASTLAPLDPSSWLGYHSLIVGVGVLAGLLFIGQSRSDDREMPLLFDPANLWPIAGAAALMLLASRAALPDPTGPWWSAVAVLGSAGIFARVAVLRQRDFWAFVAGLCVLVGVALVFVRSNIDEPFDEWRTALAQSLLITASLVGVIWLYAWHRLHSEESTHPGSRWFDVQLYLIALGNVALWIEPAVALIGSPDVLEPTVARSGTLLAWLALASSLVPVLWYLRRVVVERALDVLSLLAFGSVILAACTVARLTGESWAAYRVLMLAPTVLAGALLVISRRFTDEVTSTKVVGWIVVFTLISIGLGIWSAIHTPTALGWPALAALGVCIVWSGVGHRLGNEEWLFLAGLLFVVAVQGWTFTALDIRACFIALLSIHGWSLAWLAVGSVDRDRERDFALLGVQVWGGFVLTLLPLLFANAYLFWKMPDLSWFVRENGSLLGGLALALGLGAMYWHSAKTERREIVALTLLTIIPISIFASCVVARSSPAMAYPILLVGYLLAGLAVLVRGWRFSDSEQANVELGCIVGFGLAIGLATRMLFSPLPLAGWYAGASFALASASATFLSMRTRRESWALAACLLLHSLLSLLIAREHGFTTITRWGQFLLQANSLLGGVLALAWIAWVHRRSFSTESLQRTYLGSLVLLGMAVVVVPLVRLVMNPSPLHPSVLQGGTWLGWVGLSSIFSAVLWSKTIRVDLDGRNLRYPMALTMGCLVAFTLSPWDDGRWLVYHVLTLAWLVVGFGPLLSGYRDVRRERIIATEPIRLWSNIVIGLVLLLLVRGASVDPWSVWWYVVPLLTLAGLSGALSFFLLAPGYSLLSFGLLGSGLYLAMPGLDFYSDALLAATVATAVWSVVEPRHPARYQHISWPDALLAVLLCFWGAVLVVHMGSGVLLGSIEFPAQDWLVGAVLGLALLVSLWNERATTTLLRLYLWGLVLLVMVYCVASPNTRWVTLPVLAGLVLLVEWLRARGIDTSRFERLGLGSSLSAQWLGWLPWLQRLVALFVVAGSVLVVLFFDPFLRRLGGPLGLVILVPALVLAASRNPPEQRRTTQTLVLLLVPIILGEVLWASLDYRRDLVWIERLGFSLTMAALFHVVYLLVPALSEVPGEDWKSPMHQSTRFLGVAGLCLLVLLMLVEFVFVRGGPGLTFDSMFAIALGIALLVVSALCLAIWPSCSPTKLEDAHRLFFVYLAEGLAVALYLHVRFTHPELFSGRFSRMWTYLAIVASFGLAAFSELLRRLRVAIVAESFLKTALVLALVPVLGYSFRPVGNYALLWLLVSLLYGIVAMVRQSLSLGMLAGLFANFGLWALLYQSDRGFDDHPQLWLVPFSMSVLLGAHLNRDRLTRSQLSALRYSALTMMYLASAWETFVMGLGVDVTRPLILIALAIAGVVVGMLWRIRPFLFLGVAFIFLGVFALVWHAATNQDRVWYVAGIGFGLAIIAFFAVFEKKRKDILAMLERLREWE